MDEATVTVQLAANVKARQIRGSGCTAVVVFEKPTTGKCALFDFAAMKSVQQQAAKWSKRTDRNAFTVHYFFVLHSGAIIPTDERQAHGRNLKATAGKSSQRQSEFDRTGAGFILYRQSEPVTAPSTPRRPHHTPRHGELWKRDHGKTDRPHKFTWEMVYHGFLVRKG